MTVLVLSAHPDDAELAMGGTIAALVAGGVDVVVACFTVSEQGDARDRRHRAAHAAADVLGHQLAWVNGGEHDQVDELRDSELVTLVDREIDRWDPATIVTHWEGDSHSDHVRLAHAAIASTRRCPDRDLLQFGPNEFRTVAFTRFEPQVYSQIRQEHLKLKLRALECYQSAGLAVRELALDSVALIARSRGLEVGCDLAETFRLTRQTVDLRASATWPTRNPFH